MDDDPRGDLPLILVDIVIGLVAVAALLWLAWRALRG